MHSSTYLNWFRRLLILGAVVAGLTASAAGAGINSRPPDVSDVASTLSTRPATDVSRPPDVRDAVTSVSAAIPMSRGPAYSLGPGYLQYIQKTGWFSPALVRARSAAPDVFERYAAAHPYGSDLTSSELVSSPPDVQDAAAALHTTPEGLKADGLRWQGIAQVYQHQQSVAAPALRPDDKAGPLGVGEPTSAPVSGGSRFHWDDWAIGIGTGMGLALLLGAGLLAGRQHRHRVQPA
jgi:hypothetical protein